MAQKNPYENGVDIPDFVEKKENDIDMSVFKLVDDENEEDEEYEDEYEEYEPKRRINSKGLIVVGGAVVALLLIATITGWIFGISKSNSLTKLKAEYTTLETKLNEANTSITSLNNQITLLNNEIEKYKSGGGGSSESGEKEATGTKYKLAGDVAVRKGPSANNDYAEFSKLPDDVQDAVYEDEGTVRTRDDKIVEVYETKNDSDGNTWGRIAQNAWVCIKYQGTDWATKQ